MLDAELLRPLDWVAAHRLTILTVFGTIAAGHLMVNAARARHLFATIGFVALFMSGTCLIVYNSVGRQVETADAAMLSAEDTNAKIIDKTADLKAAKARKAFADGQVQATMTKRYCGRSCKYWKQNSHDVGVVISPLESEITALGPQKIVNAQAAAMADIVLLFRLPATKPQVVATLTLLIPFLKTMFFEIGSIVSFGVAFRTQSATTVRRPRAASERLLEKVEPETPAIEKRRSAEIVQLPRLNSSPNGSGGPKPGTKCGPGRAQCWPTSSPVLRRGERFDGQEELWAKLSGRFGKIGKSTLSGWLAELDRSIVRTTAGRQKAIG